MVEQPDAAMVAAARRRWRSATVRSPKKRGEEGYSLVVLVVALTLMHIALAVAMPLWSTSIRREREEEAIFRGLQYAEAIRVFRTRFGRYPTELKELIEVEPRSIRQLWTDPLSEGGVGGFGLLTERPGGEGDRRANRRRGRRGGNRTDNGNARGGSSTPEQSSGGSGARLTRVPPSGTDVGLGEGRVVSTASIRGVYIHSDESGIKTFQDSTKYSSWLFLDSLIPVPALVNGILPSVSSDWIGRPFRGGSSTPALASPGEDLDGSEDRPRRGRSRQDGRQPRRPRRR